MDLINLVGDAELDMIFMSGRGLGAVLLAIVALAVVWRVGVGTPFFGQLARIAESYVTRK